MAFTTKLGAFPPSPPSPPTPPIHVQRTRNNTSGLRDRVSSVQISQSRGEEDDSKTRGPASRLAMLAPKGTSWKAARARLPPLRRLWPLIRTIRFLLAVGLITLTLLLWRSMGSAAGEVQRRFYCWGPAKPPMLMTPNENVEWNAHLSTPVYNHHKPVEINDSTIDLVNLNGITSTPNAAANSERVLILTPLRDAAPFLAQHFDLLTQLTYPHSLIDLAFLVGDTTDDTKALLAKELERVQQNADIAFRSARIVEKDFGAMFAQDVEHRHEFENQGPRRKAMGRARNYLLSAALRPEHSWVYWRDVDIKDSPASIIEDFVAHDVDVLVPNIWFHRYEERDGKMVDIEGRFDYNSWQETPSGLRLAASLPKDTIIAEGYTQFPTKRTYMAKLGDWRADRTHRIPLDGIGGVSILVKADVHRSGINFPCYAFENQAETEGFAKMAKRAGYGVWGLPNYVVWHVDTKERPGRG